MEKSLIIIPVNLPLHWSTDYYEQTIQRLKKTNIVLAIDLLNIITWKNIFRNDQVKIINSKKDIYWIRLFYVFPFRRFRIIERINNVLNIYVIKLIILYLQITFQIKKKIIWIFDIDCYWLLNFFYQHYLKIYDGVDFYAGTVASHKQEHEFIKNCDIVCVNSHSLLEQYQKIRPDIHLVPQGFRKDYFQKYNSVSYKRILPKNKYIVGYVGGINYRIDYNLLIQIARNKPKVYFAFFGQIQENDENEFNNEVKSKINQLFNMKNVGYFGNIDKKMIPGVIREFDLCMIPYLERLPFNQKCYPMKLMEYFYMGKPILSTYIEELVRFPQFVFIESKLKGWIRIINNLEKQQWQNRYKQIQKQIANNNSWENKLSAIIHLIETYEN